LIDRFSRHPGEGLLVCSFMVKSPWLPEKFSWRRAALTI
jgi:hypothetical protein